MKKFSIILSSIFFIVMLTTFNPSNFYSGLQFFKIKKIEVKNIVVLDSIKIKNLFIEEFYDSNLLILDKKKIDKILRENELIEYIEFRKIYPSKLVAKVFEKKTIAIINYKQNKFFLTNKGEEIEFFQNPSLEKLPNIFGKQKNFLEIYSALQELDFPISKIKSFYYFDIGRWDIMLKNEKVIKLPVKNFTESLKNFLDLSKENNFEKYSIFDYRIKDQLILN